MEHDIRFGMREAVEDFVQSPRSARIVYIVRRCMNAFDLFPPGGARFQFFGRQCPYVPLCRRAFRVPRPLRGVRGVTLEPPLLSSQ